MKTPYGELNVGDVFVPANGRPGGVTVVDVDTYAEVEDAVVEPVKPQVAELIPGARYRIDWFKLMVVRYSKKE